MCFSDFFLYTISSTLHCIYDFLSHLPRTRERRRENGSRVKVDISSCVHPRLVLESPAMETLLVPRLYQAGATQHAIKTNSIVRADTVS